MTINLVVTDQAEITASDPAASAARAAITMAMEALGVPADVSLSLVLTGDDELAALNEQFRDQKGPTDVLSFRAEPESIPTDEEPELGDVIISVGYASRSAVERDATLTEELRLLAVHGLLHLLGHDDATEEGAAAMRAVETRLGVRLAESAGE